MVEENVYTDFEPEDEPENEEESFFDTNKIQVFAERLVGSVDTVIELSKKNLSLENYNLPVSEAYVLTAGLMDHMEDPAMEYFVSRNSKKIISIYSKWSTTAQDYDENNRVREFYIKGKTYRVKIFTKNLKLLNISEFHLSTITEIVAAAVETEVEYLELNQPANEEFFQQIRNVLHKDEKLIETPEAQLSPLDELNLDEFKLDLDEEITNFAYELRDICELFVYKNSFPISYRETEIYKKDKYSLSIKKQSSNPDTYVYSIRKAGKSLAKLAKKNHVPKLDGPVPTKTTEVDFPGIGMYAVSFYENGEQEIENLKELLGIFRESILLGEAATSETYTDVEMTESGVGTETILPDKNSEELSKKRESTLKRIWDQILKGLRGGS